MSWQAYVDTNLVGTGHVGKAVIIGLDGNTWATTAGFTIDPKEGAKLVAHYIDGGATAMASGIHVNGTKYMFLKHDDRVLIGKKGPGGVSIYKSDKALVIGVYGEGIQPGMCNSIIANLGSYLVSVGY